MNDLTGTPARHFAVKDSTGIINRLEDFKGSWLLMVFHRHLG
jgi:peroxiredoxin